MARKLSFFVQFNWTLMVPDKGPNKGTTVISIDAPSMEAAKAKAKHRFPNKYLTFTCVKPSTGH
jgi:hypothetical protein